VKIITSLSQPKSKIEAPAIPAPHVERKSSAGKRIVAISLGLLLLCLIGYGITYFFFGNTNKGEQEVMDRSIAVLPFADLSEKKDQEYFSDGLSEELLNFLSKTPELKVISRTSAFSFKGKNEDIRSIGAKLGVAYILEGSVRKAADKLRITAQLIKVSDGAQLWSENYDRELNDIFKVQGEIAEAVVRELKIKLIGSNYNMPKESDPRIYNLWLQSKFLINLGTANEETKEQAFDLIKQAYAIDSTDARVWSGFASVYYYKSLESLNLGDIEKWRDKSRLAAEKSLALDENLLDVYGVLADIAIQDWNLPLAESGLQKGLKLDPANAALMYALGNVLTYLGRFTEAERLYKKSIALDPLGARCFFNFSILYGYLGKDDEAIGQVRKALSIAPRPIYYTFLSIYYLLMNQARSSDDRGAKV
jgi:TolB-like protein/Tfp pilus assembly protein PilF